MATHSSILAWRIPCTEEPGGLQSMGCTKSDTTEATIRAHTVINLQSRDGQIWLKKEIGAAY